MCMATTGQGMVAGAGELRIGCSGFQYDHWRGIFYPPSIPKRAWFAHYAAYFDTVEINNTFYRVPERDIFQRWAADAPPGFVYALKFSRFGTHNKKLLDPEDTVGYFMERAAPLGRSLGPILVHLPPRWRCNPGRLDDFLAAARAADVRGAGRCLWAVEVRHESWLCEDVYRILRRHRAALCIHDLLPDHPPELTTDWTYLRFHGAAPDAQPGGNYTETGLEWRADTIRAFMRQAINVYAYFNNDQHGYAVANALTLRELLGQAGVSSPRVTPANSAKAVTTPTRRPGP